MFRISTFKAPYKAGVAISLDYETSAVYGDLASVLSKLRGVLLNALNKVDKHHRNLSFAYGLGYPMRYGAKNVLKILKKYGVHATWFATGHVLLKDNRRKNAFHINQLLPYANEVAGFTKPATWRRFRPTFYYEPYVDYNRKPYWYFGDQSEELRQYGEDIQCHTFSHPYVAMENPRNVELDIEDWQTVASRNAFNSASILAFPYCGDAYRYYYNLKLKAMIGRKIERQDYQIVDLPSDIAEVYERNGIELLTRCGSKTGSVNNFAIYNKTRLHYMPDIAWSACNQSVRLLESRIHRVIADGAVVNVWLHPCNVFSEIECSNFENLVRYLVEKQNNDKVWFTTIQEMWSYYKRAIRCTLHLISRRGREYEIFIHNSNEVSIKDLFIFRANMRIRGYHLDSNASLTNDGIIVKQLGPDETYRLNIVQL